MRNDRHEPNGTKRQRTERIPIDPEHRGGPPCFQTSIEKAAPLFQAAVKFVPAVKLALRLVGGGSVETMSGLPPKAVVSFGDLSE